MRSVPLRSAKGSGAGSICDPNPRAMLLLPSEPCRPLSVCEFRSSTDLQFWRARAVRRRPVLLPVPPSPEVLTDRFLLAAIQFSWVNLHCVLAAKRLQFGDSRTSASLLFGRGCWLAASACLNVSRSQVPHTCSPGPLNSPLLAGALCTLRAGPELSFSQKVTPPV